MPALRNRASKSESKSMPPTKSRQRAVANSESRRNGKGVIPKENKENVTTKRNKNVRKDVVQPLQEQNSVSFDEKTDVVQKSSALELAAESSKTVRIPANNSKKRTRKVSADDVIQIEENITETQKLKVDEPPKKRSATEKSAAVSSVTTRKKKQSKDIRPIDSPAEGTKREAVQEIIRPDSDAQKPSGKETRAKKPVFEPTVRTRSRVKSTTEKVSPIRHTRKPRQLDKQESSAKTAPMGKRAAAVSPHATRSTTKRNKVKSPPVKNVTLRRKIRKNSSTEAKKPEQVANLKSSEESSLSTEKTKSSKPVPNLTSNEKPSSSIDKKKSSKPVQNLKSSEESSSSTEQKKSSKPVPNLTSNDEASTSPQPQFVTTRKNRRNMDSAELKSDNHATAANVDKSAAEEPVISNVTTRRKGAAPNNSNEVRDGRRSKRSKSVCISMNKGRMEANLKDGTIVRDIPRNKRSQSVNRATNEREVKTNSSIKCADAVASPAKRQRITNKADRNINGKLTKQPELLVNRSTASDSSDQSNGSVIPVYKRNSNSNNNTVNSVFDFESNSQENTIDTDEQMQEVVAKLVRENKASVVKRRPNAKKGVTKAKTNVSRLKQIEKIRCDLSELKQFQMRSAKVNASNVQPTKSIPKLQTSKSLADSPSRNTRNATITVDEADVRAKETASKPHQNKLPLDQPELDAVEDVDDVDDVGHMDDAHDVDVVELDDLTIDVGPVQGNIHVPETQSLLKLASTSEETPPRLFQATYTGPKKVNALYQSTPIRIATSPWRYDAGEVKYSENVFSRYSELEKSPIKSSDITKIAAETKSPSKKPRPPSATTSAASTLPEVVKPKALANDLQNGFGFFDDDDEDNNDNQPSLPRVNSSFGSLNAIENVSGKSPSPKKPKTIVPSQKKTATTVTSQTKSVSTTKTTSTLTNSAFKMPQVFSSLKEKVKLLKSSHHSSVSSTLLNEPKLKSQTKITTLFGDSRLPARSKPSSSSRANKMTASKSKVETTQRTKEISQTETATTLFEDTDNFSLFESSWLDGETKPHRSYSRVTKRDRDHKRQYDHNSVITDDDESVFGDTFAHKRTKRTKPKDDKREEELRQFEEKYNSEFMEVENFEMLMEKSA